MKGGGPGRLRHRLGTTIEVRGLWERGARVAVAVSGGIDSICLLDLLVATQGMHGAELSVVTIDHGTRTDSAAHAAFVQTVAADLGLPCRRFDLSLGHASEAVARAARHSCFDQLPVDRVALAHHRDDQAETVLIQLLRGTGTAGLAGMSWLRGRLARPLLEVSRVELLAWAEHRGLQWREDPSNTDRRFLRNRLRAEVMPLLEQIRPGASAAMARSATIVADDDALLLALLAAEPAGAADRDGWSVQWLVEAPPALARRALLRVVSDLGAHHIDAVLQGCRRGVGVVALPGGRRLRVDGTRLRLERDELDDPP